MKVDNPHLKVDNPHLKTDNLEDDDRQMIDNPDNDDRQMIVNSDDDKQFSEAETIESTHDFVVSNSSVKQETENSSSTSDLTSTKIELIDIKENIKIKSISEDEVES